MTAHDEAVERQYAQSMIAGVANKEIAGTDTDAVGINQLSGTTTGAAKAGNVLEGAFARIETLKLRTLGIKKIDTTVWANSYVARCCEPTETSAGLSKETSAFRCERQDQRLFR